jgi:putative tricarboxylic transport membrane protein
MKKNDVIYGAVFIALGIFIFTQTVRYPSLEKGHPGPGLFPNLLAILFILFGGLLIYKALKSPSLKEREEIPPGPKKVSNAFFVLGIIIVFVTVFNSVGFLITSAVLLFLLMKKLGVTLLRSAIASVVITLFINLMFSKILRVPLPVGILGW